MDTQYHFKANLVIILNKFLYDFMNYLIYPGPFDSTSSNINVILAIYYPRRELKWVGVFTF